MKYLLLVMLLLTSCSSHQLSDYENENPKINLKEFFNGNIKALGIVQDRSKKIIKRFEVDIKASWNGDVGTLNESFDYSDGTKSKRIWTLTETSKNSYIGTAGDGIGNAEGAVKGNAFYFEYQLKLPVGDSVYNVSFEDWMFLLNSKTLLARSYMTKFGINLGEVTIVMMKKE